MLVILVVSQAACTWSTSKPAGSPTPVSVKQILAKAADSTMASGHFSATQLAHLQDGGTAELTGDGVLLVKPQSGLEMHVKGGGNLFGDFILVDSVGYSRISPRTYYRTGAKYLERFQPNVWRSADTTALVGDEKLAGVAAWHVNANYGGLPDDTRLDLWIRKSDGYPLRIQSNGANAFNLVFDSFNKGGSISAPSGMDLGLKEDLVLTGPLAGQISVAGAVNQCGVISGGNYTASWSADLAGRTYLFTMLISGYGGPGKVAGRSLVGFTIQSGNTPLYAVANFPTLVVNADERSGSIDFDYKPWGAPNSQVVGHGSGNWRCGS